MTKVLIITNKGDITTDFVINRLQKREIPYYRLNTEDICQGLYLTIHPQDRQCFIKDTFLGADIDLMEFDSVYFRRPEIREYNDNELSPGERAFLTTEVYYSLEGLYKILDEKYWISPLFAIREAENKVYQLMLAQQIGFVTPDTVLSSNVEDINSFLKRINAPCIIKPVHNGRVMDGDNPQVVYTSILDESFDMKQAVFSPNYLQRKIDKVYDVRVTIVGETVFAVRIDSQSSKDTQVDWRKGQTILKHEVISLPSEVEDKCKQMINKLRLRYAALDFAIDKQGRFVFFEINPNGQWAWIEHLTGLPISNELVNLLLAKNV